jgi:multidrug transporter EmrE-like cation transporter
METNNTPPNFIKQLTEYLENRYKLLKHQSILEGSSIFSRIVTDVAIIISATIAFVLFSVVLALFLGKLLDANWKGFGIVAVIYLLIAIFQKLFKISMENMLILISIKKIFGDKGDSKKSNEA